MTDKFHVHQFFSNGTNEQVTTQPLLAEQAVLKAHAITKSPACRIGTTVRVIITDAGDYCVFDWKFGKGVVFPPPPAKP